PRLTEVIPASSTQGDFDEQGPGRRRRQAGQGRGQGRRRRPYRQCEAPGRRQDGQGRRQGPAEGGRREERRPQSPRRLIFAKIAVKGPDMSGPFYYGNR